MTQTSSLITDEMRAAIGRESEPVTYEVDNLGCRQFARAVGYSSPYALSAAFKRVRGVSPHEHRIAQRPAAAEVTS